MNKLDVSRLVSAQKGALVQAAAFKGLTEFCKDLDSGLRDEVGVYIRDLQVKLGQGTNASILMRLAAIPGLPFPGSADIAEKNVFDSETTMPRDQVVAACDFFEEFVDSIGAAYIPPQSRLEIYKDIRGGGITIVWIDDVVRYARVSL